MTLHASALRQSPLDSLHTPAYRSRSSSSLSLLLLPHRLLSSFSLSPCNTNHSLYQQWRSLHAGKISPTLISLKVMAIKQRAGLLLTFSFSLAHSFLCVCVLFSPKCLLLSLLNHSQFFICCVFLQTNVFLLTVQIRTLWQVYIFFEWFNSHSTISVISYFTCIYYSWLSLLSCSLLSCPYLAVSLHTTEFPSIPALISSACISARFLWTTGFPVSLSRPLAVCLSLSPRRSRIPRCNEGWLCWARSAPLPCSLFPALSLRNSIAELEKGD